MFPASVALTGGFLPLSHLGSPVYWILCRSLCLGLALLQRKVEGCHPLGKMITLEEGSEGSWQLAGPENIQVATSSVPIAPHGRTALHSLRIVSLPLCHIAGSKWN